MLQVLSFPIFNPWVDPKRRLAERLNHWWGVATLWAFPGIDIRVEGHLGPGPYVLCANHKSAADIIMLLAQGPTAKFIARRGIFWIPVIGLSMRLAGYVVAGTEKTMDQAVRWLQRGCNVLTFPEGTRSPDERTLRFRQGAFVLARKAGVPVVPVAISGTHHLLHKGAFRFNPDGPVRIRILDPMVVEGDPKRVASAVRAKIDAAVA